MASFQRQSAPLAGIIVVDNASTDDTVTRLGREFPQVQVIRNSTNRGFAGAANQGLKQALSLGADFVLVANNDVVADDEMVAHLVVNMGPEVGVVAPLIYYLGDQRRIWSAGFRRRCWLPEPSRGWRGEIDPGNLEGPMPVDYVLGCAMLLSRKVLLEVGGFDERYFFYYEDLDLCARLRRAGYRCLTIPSARLWHEVAGSAGFDSPFRIYHMARGSAIFLASHTSGFERWLAPAYRSLVAAKKTARYLGAGRIDLVRALLAGTADGCRAQRERPRIPALC